MMLLGEILAAKGWVSEEDIERALEYQRQSGGRFGDCLVKLGVVTHEQIESLFNEIPKAPTRLEDIDVDPMLVLQLMVKAMYVENLARASQIADALKLPQSIVEDLLDMTVDRRLTEVVGQTESLVGAFGEKRYVLSTAGKDWAIESLDISQYVGPAPVSLNSYEARVLQQKISHELVCRPAIEQAFSHLVIADRFLDRLGPFINSGEAMLIYGPAGNGKTSIAECIGHVFRNVVYIPHCFEVDGNIVKVFDPAVHRPIYKNGNGGEQPISLQRDEADLRWVPCHRPMIVTGGELTLDMLDLKFSEISKFYEAPLHIKALNGIFLIDDFGRQRAEPEDILNRWIMPLNNRVDYLQLHTGKSFQVPFDELVIFSTNLHPAELMDPAFLRRISYKLETEAPPEAVFRQVFEDMASSATLELTEDIYQQVLDTIRENEAPLAYFQPKFIVNQVLASCKFQNMAPQFTQENVEDAMLNLFVNSSYEGIGKPTAAKPLPVRPRAALTA
jgi:hypothetical protein